MCSLVSSEPILIRYLGTVSAHPHRPNFSNTMGKQQWTRLNKHRWSDNFKTSKRTMLNFLCEGFYLLETSAQSIQSQSRTFHANRQKQVLVSEEWRPGPPSTFRPSGVPRAQLELCQVNLGMSKKYSKHSKQMAEFYIKLATVCICVLVVLHHKHTCPGTLQRRGQGTQSTSLAVSASHLYISYITLRYITITFTFTFTYSYIHAYIYMYKYMHMHMHP
jgi:hypothetical protein